MNEEEGEKHCTRNAWMNRTDAPIENFIIIFDETLVQSSCR